MVFDDRSFDFDNNTSSNCRLTDVQHTLNSISIKPRYQEGNPSVPEDGRFLLPEPLLRVESAHNFPPLPHKRSDAYFVGPSCYHPYPELISTSVHNASMSQDKTHPLKIVAGSSLVSDVSFTQARLSPLTPSLGYSGSRCSVYLHEAH